MSGKAIINPASIGFLIESQLANAINNTRKDHF